MPSSTRHLDPGTIARLHGLELRARTVTAGMMTGMHRSAYRGYSIEFAEHRQYVPGDDIRHMDWRIFGRADRLYIKQYEEETNLRCNILLDVSRSMAYGSGPLSKIEYACTLAACLTYMLDGQHDASGLLTFDSDIRAKLACGTGRGHFHELLQILEASHPAKVTDVKILFHRLAEELQHRSMVVLISDLLAPPDDVVSGLEHIAYAGHELIVLHVMDDHEWNFPFVENTYFEGLEDDVKLLADPQSLRDSYLAAVQRFVTRVRGACLKHRADYIAVNTRDPLDVVLWGYLDWRSRMSGGARRR